MDNFKVKGLKAIFLMIAFTQIAACSIDKKNLDAPRESLQTQHNNMKAMRDEQISRLEVIAQRQQQRIESLEIFHHESMRRIAELEQTVLSQQNQIGQLKASHRKTLSEIKQRDLSIDQFVERHIPNKTQSPYYQASGQFVGFMATPLENREYEPGDRIIFDDVIMDPSNAYNATTSAFTCPYSGYYDFKVTVANVRDTETNIWERVDGALYINGQTVIKAYATANQGNTNYATQSSISGVFRCNGGEEVYVQQANGANRGVFGTEHSLFAGYLIRMDT